MPVLCFDNIAYFEVFIPSAGKILVGMTFFFSLISISKIHPKVLIAG